MLSAREFVAIWFTVVLVVVAPALRRRIARGRLLRNIPAPEGAHWLAGASPFIFFLNSPLHLVQGHIFKWFNAEHGLAYQTAASERFGRVFRINGVFYVSAWSSRSTD